MAVWQRPARVGLATFSVAFGVAVLLGIRDRSVPAVAVGVDRTDPDAVVQSRGARIVQTDASSENLRVVAERQLTYADGSVRFVDGVEVVVVEREDRTDFRLSGDEATVVEEAGDVSLVGSVQFRSGDGLVGRTETASYSDGEGTVTMPQAAEFSRSWMRAHGNAARYDQRQDLLYLEPGAAVELLPADGAVGPTTEIASHAAVLAQRDGYMRFNGGVTVAAETQTMEADEVRTTFDVDATRLNALELAGNARIRGADENPGQLRVMTAPAINVAYGAEAPERAELAGGAWIELFGQDRAGGATIVARVMDVALGAGGVGLDDLHARGNVAVELPGNDEGVTARIRADALEITGGSEAGLTDARFDGSVEYREAHRGEPADATGRTTRAERLEATLSKGLTSLDDARFVGSVSFEDTDIRGQADAAIYALGDGTFTLMTLGAAGQTPRVVDRRGSVQADRITITLPGSGIEATGSVESVLSSSGADTGDAAASDVRRPRLLAEGQPTYVTAGRLVYDADTSIATYSGAARLWQEETEFRGASIVLDESTGNVLAEGAVRTRTTILQNDDDTGEQVETSTEGQGDSVSYDDALRQATYTTDAELKGQRFHLKAGTIEVFLHEDARTLDRIVAVDDVTLQLDNRRVVGSTLTYYDADGRYEMSGEPVRIVEETDDECRETTGRTMIFFLTAEAVSVDGQSAVRTASTNGACTTLLPS